MRFIRRGFIFNDRQEGGGQSNSYIPVSKFVGVPEELAIDRLDPGRPTRGVRLLLITSPGSADERRACAPFNNHDKHTGYGSHLLGRPGRVVRVGRALLQEVLQTPAGLFPFLFLLSGRRHHGRMVLPVVVALAVATAVAVRAAVLLALLAGRTILVHGHVAARLVVAVPVAHALLHSSLTRLVPGNPAAGGLLLLTWPKSSTGPTTRRWWTWNYDGSCCWLETTTTPQRTVAIPICRQTKIS